MKKIALLLGLSVFLAPSLASAEPFSAKFAGTEFGAVTGVGKSSRFNVFAGQIKWNVGLDDLLTTFCVDLTRHLEKTQDFEAPANLFAAPKFAAVSFLVATTFSNAASKWAGSGLQLVIWTVLYDAEHRANNETKNGTFNGTAIFHDTNSGQDKPTPTPEPGTLVLLGAGVLTLAARRRQRQKS